MEMQSNVCAHSHRMKGPKMCTIVVANPGRLKLQLGQSGRGGVTVNRVVPGGQALPALEEATVSAIMKRSIQLISSVHLLPITVLQAVKHNELLQLVCGAASRTTAGYTQPCSFHR